jgi:thioredoxin reductase
VNTIDPSHVYRLAIVGAGQSALSALQAGLDGKDALLLDYQDGPGGFLRHALTAPGLEDLAAFVQATVLPDRLTTCFNSTAVGLLPAFVEGEPHTLMVRRSSGTIEVRAAQVLLACGGLELTRESAQIPGPRPAGVMTPVFAHQLLNRGYAPGRRIVVYGNSRYTQATAHRLALAGLSVTLVSPLDEPDPPQPVALSSALTFLPPARLVALAGFPRLEEVTFERAGVAFTLPADTLVYATGMRANSHWLKGSGLNLTAQGAVEVDARYQTSIHGIYAIGTAVSPSLDHEKSRAMGKEVALLLSGGAL